MAEKRKLLNEIEKCYKKIEEGFEIFDDIMAKMNEANSENQREKFQDDLKKEIKKLQRLRDQIKGWQNSSDDKDSLTKFRKLIENRMELFKEIERENKTKPHSKQGLSIEDKLDPKEKEKHEVIEWLNCQIRKIEDEVDRTESKLEVLTSAGDSGKKRGTKKEDKRNDRETDELKKHLDRVKFHLTNLEVCLRLITNEKLQAKDTLEKLKEPLELYIEALDPESDDTPENFDPEDVYEELNLPNYISQLGCMTIGGADDEKSQSNDNGHCGSPPQATDISQRHQSGDSIGPQKSASATSASIAITPLKLTRLGSSQVSSDAVSLVSPLPQTPPTLPGIPYNSIVAGKTSSSVTAASAPTMHSLITTSFSGATTSTVTTSSAIVHQPKNAANVILTSTPEKTSSLFQHSQACSPVGFIVTTTATNTSPSQTPPIVTLKPAAAYGAPPAAFATSTGPTQTSTTLDMHRVVTTPVSTINSIVTPSATVSASFEKISTISPAASELCRPRAPLTEMNKYEDLSQTTATNDLLTNKIMEAVNAVDSDCLAMKNVPTNLQSSENSTSQLLSTLNNLTSDLLSTNNGGEIESPIEFNRNVFRQQFCGSLEPRSTAPQETVIHPWLGASPLGPTPIHGELEQQLQLADTSMPKAPLQMDSERQRAYLPKMPCPTPSYYPQSPLATVDSLDYYLRLSVETLFFIFYYMEGTRAQLLAAKALKKLSWRFHTKYLMWFQRHEEPKQITDDYEQGTYVYFDFEKWMQRKKDQFTFEYKYLEDKELPD